MKKLNIELFLKSKDAKAQSRQFSMSVLPKDVYKTRGVFDVEKRLAEFSLSSETPYLRSTYLPDENGEYKEFKFWEVLGHNEGEIDFSRLKNGSNLFLNHIYNSPDEVVLGVIENVEVKDKRIIEIVRFSDNPIPDQVFNDLHKRIRGKVSVGYDIISLVDTGELIDGIPVYRATLWLPLESSVCGIAADDGVGFYRLLDSEDGSEAAAKILDKLEPKAETAELKKTNVVQTEINIIREGKKMTEAVLTPIDKKEIDEILAVGAEWKRSEEAAKWVQDGKRYVDYVKHVNTQFKNNPDSFHKDKKVEDVGMSEKEKKKYDFMNVLRHICGDDKDGDKFDAGFEIELSNEVMRKNGFEKKKQNSIFIPPDILKSQRNFDLQAMARMHAQNQRDMNQGTSSAGGYFVETHLETGSLIDVLRNALVLGRLGCTVMRDLKGVIDIPRVVTATSGSWVAENGSAVEGSVVLDKVTMTDKVATGNTTLSRQFRRNSGIDGANFVFNELFKTIALTIDAGGINGTAADNQPRGVRNVSGINTVATDTNGSAITWANVIDLETAIANDNADQGSMAYLSNSKVFGSTKKTPIVSGQPLMIYNNNQLNGMPFLKSNMIPSNITKAGGSNLSTMLCGYWADLILGFFGGFEIALDDKFHSIDGRQRITAFQNFDCVVRHAESFAELSGLIA